MVKFIWGGEATKHIALLLIAIALSCTITLPITNDWETVQPDTGQRFRIWQSFIKGYPDGKDTDLRVILCTDDITDLNAIFQEVRVFHNRMNGKSDSLTIYLYKSKKDFLDGDCFAIKTYQKGENEDEKEIDDRSIDSNNSSHYEHDCISRPVDK